MSDKVYLTEKSENVERSKQYLAHLLKAVYPNIEPLPNLLGLCTQIDNGFAVPLLRQQGKRD